MNKALVIRLIDIYSLINRAIMCRTAAPTPPHLVETLRESGDTRSCRNTAYGNTDRSDPSRIGESCRNRLLMFRNGRRSTYQNPSGARTIAERASRPMACLSSPNHHRNMRDLFGLGRGTDSLTARDLSLTLA
jgi:hypothetical protein